jgi:DNA-binding transcriptional MerR regulator
LNKSPEAFRTISEAAQELKLPQHVLRFWETRFPQIKPMKRGGGRRYYRPGDVDLLKGIRHLLYDKGFTIRGVQRILREQGTPHAVAIGRGEVAAEPHAAEPPAAATEQSEGMLEAKRGGKLDGESGGARHEPAATAHVGAGLTEAESEQLRLAMEDLAAARQILGGVAK